MPQPVTCSFSYANLTECQAQVWKQDARGPALNEFTFFLIDNSQPSSTWWADVPPIPQVGAQTVKYFPLAGRGDLGQESCQKRKGSYKVQVSSSRLLEHLPCRPGTQSL